MSISITTLMVSVLALGLLASIFYEGFNKRDKRFLKHLGTISLLLAISGLMWLFVSGFTFQYDGSGEWLGLHGWRMEQPLPSYP